MPHALPAIDLPVAGNAMPSDVERVALVANPFGTELERAARIASLHDQFVALGRLPEFFVEAVARRRGRRHSSGQVGFRFRSFFVFAARHRNHPRRIRSLTGVTIGPDTTIEIPASLTWQVEVPRTWRAASMISSSPCM